MKPVNSTATRSDSATAKEPVKTMNKLLRGELSAVETYEQALEKVGDEPQAAELRQISIEHREAVRELSAHVRKMGGVPDQSAGVWGTFAKTVEGTAKLFGETAAIKALKEGEEHGVNDYTEALTASKLEPECQQLINDLVRRQRRHITVLDSMIETL